MHWLHHRCCIGKHKSVQWNSEKCKVYKQGASDLKDFTFVNFTTQLFSSAYESLKDEMHLQFLLLWIGSLVTPYTFVFIYIYIYIYTYTYIYICLWHVRDGNKAKCLLLVDHVTKTIYRQFIIYIYIYIYVYIYIYIYKSS